MSLVSVSLSTSPSLSHTQTHTYKTKKTMLFLGLVNTKHICVSITVFSVCLLILYQVNLRSLVLSVKWSQLLRGTLWEVFKATSKHLISYWSAACFCLISLASPAKSLSWTSFVNMEKQGEREGERQHDAVYLNANNSTDQTG